MLIVPIVCGTGAQESTVSSTLCWAADKPIGMPGQCHLPNALAHTVGIFLPNAGAFIRGQGGSVSMVGELPAEPAASRCGSRDTRHATGAGRARWSTQPLT